MIRVQGIVKTALYVTDLDRAASFYRELFGFEMLLKADRLIALNVADKCVLLLFLAGITEEPAETVGGVIPPHGPGGKYHFAFAVAKEDFSTWQAELSARHVPIESVVNWPGGARSLYFRDPDENLVELLTPGFWANY